jgi:hypothetical protein
MLGRSIRLAIGGFVVAFGLALGGAAIARRRIASVGTPEDDEIALAAILGPVEFESHAIAFRGGSLLCWFGGGDVDLRGATLDSTGARLLARALFGGGRIIVPETWIVDLHVRAIFGGGADVRPAIERAPDAPRLVIEGWAAFGGFGVFASRPEVDESDPPEPDED